LKGRAESPKGFRRWVSGGDVAAYGLIVVAVLLGWQIVLQPLIQRASVQAVVGLAPTSPTVLRRAAESELAAGRVDNAAQLSRDALLRSPFDVRALRVLGLTEARSGREDIADDILTLAGNWSLRDDPTHAWLTERRLRQGDYASSFAHADTLVRRRRDIQPQVFSMFTLAGIQDPKRALPVLARLLTARPPWRTDYLNGLRRTPQELQLAANLTILLEEGRAPLTNDELQELYWALLRQSQFPALIAIRERIKRPPPRALSNGDFADPEAPQPFQWRLYQKAGVVPEVVADDLRPSNPALRVQYNGYAAGVIVEQLTFLSPGSHRFSAEVRIESGEPHAPLSWTLSCAPGDNGMTRVPVEPSSTTPSIWTTLSGRFDVPTNCPAQWLRLATRANDRRSPTVVWFDGIAISEGQ